MSTLDFCLISLRHGCFKSHAKVKWLQICGFCLVVELARGGSVTSRASLSSCTMLSSLLLETRGLLKKASRFLSGGILAARCTAAQLRCRKVTFVSLLSGGTAVHIQAPIDLRLYRHIPLSGIRESSGSTLYPL